MRLMLALLLIFGIFISCFLIFQYRREADFKTQLLNSTLQDVNRGLYVAIGQGADIERFISSYDSLDMNGLRITVISDSGRIIYDSEHELSTMDNHSRRPEVQSALATGSGYTIYRHSESTRQDYFYSATRFGDTIIRSALPYSVSLREMLRADRHFIWFVAILTLVLSVIGFFLCMNTGRSIARLRLFASRIDNGQSTEDIASFPSDELGEIAAHIVQLYDRLRQAKEDLENEQNILLRQEQEQIRIKRQLTQNINHELKTPVSSIQGYLETILNNPGLTQKQILSFVDKSYRQTVRLSQLLSDVSTLTRLDEGQEMIEKEPLNLSEVINEAITDTSLAASERGFKVTASIPEKISMPGNHSMLLSIFRNLIDNALAYSGGRNIEISVVKQDRQSITMSFADDGVGVAPEHLNRIFERFYRVDKGRSRKLGGTGLGLSIVKNAVLLHGGSISAHLRDMGGLEFIFTLRTDDKTGISDSSDK